MQSERKHVFVINGAPVFLNLMRDLFQEEAYNVTTTNFVPRSFAQIAALQPDVLIVDIVAGQRDGWILLERLQAEASTSGIPVMIVSTSERLIGKAQEQVARYGGNAYLRMPFDVGELLQAVEDLIGKA